MGVESLAMLAIALGNALWGRLLLGAMAPQSQSYLISLDGSEVGFATLTIERISQKEIKYAWKAELAISGDPCLRSIEETRPEKTKLSDAVLPEELFVALAPDIGNRLPQDPRLRSHGANGTGLLDRGRTGACRGDAVRHAGPGELWARHDAGLGALSEAGSGLSHGARDPG